MLGCFGGSALGRCWQGGDPERGPHGWAKAGHEQTAGELGHVNIRLTSLGVRGAQLWLSKAKASVCHRGPNRRVVLLAIAPLWDGGAD